MFAPADLVRFVLQAGPFIWLQFLIVWVVVLLAMVNAVLLALRRGKPAARLRTSIDSILFWGCLTAILGFLAQWIGLNRAANHVIDRGVVNPQFVMLGLGESLHTTVFGLFTLLGAGFLWFALRAAQDRRAAL